MPPFELKAFFGDQLLEGEFCVFFCGNPTRASKLMTGFYINRLWIRKYPLDFILSTLLVPLSREEDTF